MPVKVGCISLGCPKNLVDSEIMLGTLNPEKYEITLSMQEAEVIIVNTCAFIGDAKEESIDTILEAASFREKGNLKALIVTGCLAQRYKEEIIREIPEVDAVVGTGDVLQIPKVVEEHVLGKKERRMFINDPGDVEYLDNHRMLSVPGATQYLKIAEGCSNFCTYCIIPKLRGPFRSRTAESILTEAKELVKQGAKELILIAQDVSRYGEDRCEEKDLAGLIRLLSNISDLKWIRLLYCYPERMNDTLIHEMKNNPKLINYLDIPIQHASDRILKSMGRKSKLKELSALMEKLRNAIPDIILRTSVITGFPGETEDDFKSLLDFVKTNPFDRLGAFAYSREEGTPAATMTNQVDENVKQERRRKLLDIQQNLSIQRSEKRVGRVYETLVEGVADDGIFYYGRSYGEAPGIDPVIYFTAREPLETGSYVKVKILTLHQMDLVGEVIDGGRDNHEYSE